MRIIAGTAGSRVIQTPKGQDTRPTLDQVREALFNILQARCADARVLDLFAGSGALALEALSRGAEKAVLSDLSPQVVQVIKSNVAALGFQDQALVLQGDWRKTLAHLKATGECFDLIFLDPPYKMEDLTEVTNAILADSLLAEDGLVVIEHDYKVTPTVCGELTLKDRRKYGVAGISFYWTTS